MDAEDAEILRYVRLTELVNEGNYGKALNDDERQELTDAGFTYIACRHTRHDGSRTHWVDGKTRRPKNMPDSRMRCPNIARLRTKRTQPASKPKQPGLKLNAIDVKPKLKPARSLNSKLSHG